MKRGGTPAYMNIRGHLPQARTPTKPSGGGYGRETQEGKRAFSVELPDSHVATNLNTEGTPALFFPFHSQHPRVAKRSRGARTPPPVPQEKNDFLVFYAPKTKTIFFRILRLAAKKAVFDCIEAFSALQ